MSTGFVTTSLMIAAFVLIAQVPPMPKHSSPFNLRFAFTWLVNEHPFLGLWWLAAGTVPVLVSGQLHGTVS